jgi:hypothetical protein
MSNAQPQQRHEIGMVGLGVMGRSLVLNMADHGFSVAGYDKDPAKVAALRQESGKRDAHGAADIKEFVGLLRRPRAIMMLVPAGAPVDSVIKDLLPHLDKGDLIIDGGNSYFKGLTMLCLGEVMPDCLRDFRPACASGTIPTHSKVDIAFGPSFTAAQLMNGSSIKS